MTKEQCKIDAFVKLKKMGLTDPAHKAGVFAAYNARPVSCTCVSLGIVGHSPNCKAPLVQKGYDVYQEIMSANAIRSSVEFVRIPPRNGWDGHDRD